MRPEEVDREVDAREVGTYAHDLLAKTYARLAVSGIPRVTPECLGEVLATLDAVIAELRPHVPVNGSVAERLAVVRAERWVRNALGEDAEFLPGFAPTGLELSFGGDEMPIEFAGARIRGRVDRVDTRWDAAFVTDYKSSRAVTPLAKFEREGRVQAVVYAAAVEQALRVPVVGSVYRSLSSGRLGGYWRQDLSGDAPRGLCEDAFVGERAYGELLERTEERVAEAVAGMRAGRIPRSPQVKDSCKYCAIKSVCGGATS